MTNNVLNIVSFILQALSSYFGYEMLRIMRTQLRNQSVALVSATTPRALLFKSAKKIVWVLFLLPLASIAWFVLLDQQPTHWSILVLCFALVVLVFNTTTYILATAVFKFTTMRDELRRTTEQLRDTMSQPLKDQEDLANFVKKLDERVKALEKRSPSSLLEMLAGLPPK